MGDSPSSHFLQCYAWLSVSRGWEAKRERETPPVCLPQGTLQLERTPLSFSSLPFSIPPFPFSLCRVACLSSLPCSIWAWEGWISPPCMSLDNIWIATGGGRGLERRTEAARTKEKERKYRLHPGGFHHSCQRLAILENNGQR